MKRKTVMLSGRVSEGQQTANVYCKPDGSVSVWVVIDEMDYFAFTATQADMARVPEKPFRDALIKSGQGIALYRLSTGELQFNTATDYVFHWNGCLAA